MLKSVDHLISGHVQLQWFAFQPTVLNVCHLSLVLCLDFQNVCSCKHPNIIFDNIGLNTFPRNSRIKLKIFSGLWDLHIPSEDLRLQPSPWRCTQTVEISKHLNFKSQLNLLAQKLSLWNWSTMVSIWFDAVYGMMVKTKMSSEK